MTGIELKRKIIRFCGVIIFIFIFLSLANGGRC
jgi:hypothetical protein